MGSRTFTMIKPNAVAKGYAGRIFDMLLADGFILRALKMVFMSRNDAVKFYSVHRGKPFFQELIDFMTSGAVIVAILEKDDAVASLRRIVGNTNPDMADKSTIRCMFGESLTRNAIHASDSEKNAMLEWAQFFLDSEIIDADYSCP